MFRKTVILSVVFFQLVQMAPLLASFDIVDCGKPVSLISAMSLVNYNLLAQLNPLDTLINISAHMANNSAPAQPANKDTRRHLPEAVLIISSAMELFNTNSPSWPINGFAMFAAIFMVFLLTTAGRDGIVLCRIQHLFARAREGICAISGFKFTAPGKFPLIFNKVNGNFLFYACRTLSMWNPHWFLIESERRLQLIFNTVAVSNCTAKSPASENVNGILLFLKHIVGCCPLRCYLRFEI